MTAYDPALNEKRIIWSWDMDSDAELDDERANLASCNDSFHMAVLTDRGLWNGRSKGFYIIENATLDRIFENFEDRPTWFSDEEDIRCEDVHHDGTNYYLYRKITSDVLDEIVYEGCPDDKWLLDNSESIEPLVRNVYGWQ